MREYIKYLAEQHSLVHHDDNGECHFSSLSEEAQNLFARKMHYPCVVYSAGDIDFAHASSISTAQREVTILVLDHCKDSGNYNLIRHIFDSTEKIMKDFMARMERDKRKSVQPIRRFNYDGAEAHQIYLESAGLYGWALIFMLAEPFFTGDCDSIFDDKQ